jgi:hypothetical protein
MAIITSISRNNNNTGTANKNERKERKKNAKDALKNKANWLKCSPKLIC